MSTNSDPADLTAAQLIAFYRDKRLSPVEATRAILARIERLNPSLNAYCHLDPDTTIAMARASEQRWHAGAPCGPLDGVPVSVKDLLYARGWPTRRGSLTIAADGPWDDDAPVTARLREAGAVLLGKTTTPEFGWKGVTDSALTGITRNPWDPTRTPGGSSGGAAAAVASGMGPLALGTDGGGSIRMPCGFTGLFGIKPSFGRVPAWPLSPFGTIAHVGPITRTVGDAARLLNVISRPDIRDWHALPYDGTDYSMALDNGVRGWRIAFSATLGFATVDPEVAHIVAGAVRWFEQLGAVVETCDPGFADQRETFDTHWFSGAAYLASGLSSDARAMLDPGLQSIIAAGERISRHDYLDAVNRRGALGLRMQQFHQRFDVLLTPTLPIPAFAAGQETPDPARDPRWMSWTPFTYPFNLTQQPAATVPCGLTAAGLPVGLQIVGPRYGDAAVLQAALAFESARPFPMPAV